MTGRFPRRSTMFATVVAAANTLGAIGFAGISFGAVIVGETRRIELGPKATPGMDAMKAQYRRPATIPFPKENPYTPEKATRQEALFRYAALGDVGAILRKLSQPGLRLG